MKRSGLSIKGLPRRGWQPVGSSLCTGASGPGLLGSLAFALLLIRGGQRALLQVQAVSLQLDPGLRLHEVLRQRGSRGG